MKSLLFTALVLSLSHAAFAQVGVGAKVPTGAEVIMDGSRAMLDEKWTYWEGPGFRSADRKSVV